ncbi:MAG: hypothetical protein Q4D03_05280 [Bacteroidales bacterium]|nr:hypothetical protein [Bacteroidales bacterium]
MKRIFTVAALTVLMLGSLSVNAQNKFKGIVKYTISSTGEVPINIPAESSTAEIKVMGEQMVTSSLLFTNSPMINRIIQDGRKVTVCQDLSMLLAYLAAKDIELTTYSGDGKIFVRHTYSQSDIDSLTIPVTEGYYIEYVAGETKKIAGHEAKLARLHMFDEEGKDNTLDIWYDDAIGPEVNNFAQGVKGMPLEFTQNLGEGRAITVSATEIVKGKVKDVDFLMPAGFKEMDKETQERFNEELSEEMKYLQDE